MIEIPVGTWLADSTVNGRRFKVFRVVDEETVEIVDDGADRPRLVNRLLLEAQLRSGEVKSDN